MNVADNAIVMLSGVSCVGKTTTAYEIIKKYPQFRRVSEIDLVRTIVRTAYARIADEEKLGRNQIIEKYEALFNSLTMSDFKTAKSQSEFLVPYVMEIILRQQRRRIPTIIEGAGIIPGTFFPNDCALPWMTESVILINLYLSDENEHFARRHLRSLERDYCENDTETRRIVSSARVDKNLELHNETLRLSHIHKNVFSIDTANQSPQNLADIIMGIVSEYFSKLLNT